MDSVIVAAIVGSVATIAAAVIMAFGPGYSVTKALKCIELLKELDDSNMDYKVKEPKKRAKGETREEIKEDLRNELRGDLLWQVNCISSQPRIVLIEAFISMIIIIFGIVFLVALFFGIDDIEFIASVLVIYYAILAIMAVAALMFCPLVQRKYFFWQWRRANSRTQVEAENKQEKDCA